MFFLISNKKNKVYNNSALLALEKIFLDKDLKKLFLDFVNIDYTKEITLLDNLKVKTSRGAVTLIEEKKNSCIYVTKFQLNVLSRYYHLMKSGEYIITFGGNLIEVMGFDILYSEFLINKYRGVSILLVRTVYTGENFLNTGFSYNDFGLPDLYILIGGLPLEVAKWDEVEQSLKEEDTDSIYGINEDGFRVIDKNYLGILDYDWKKVSYKIHKDAFYNLLLEMEKLDYKKLVDYLGVITLIVDKEKSSISIE